MLLAEEDLIQEDNGLIIIKQKGNYSKITKYLEKLKRKARLQVLDKYGKRGVDLLRSATPVDTGLTSESWIYEIKDTSKGSQIIFRNTNVNDGVVIAILLQYGHGTGSGGWVEGVDYINPVMSELFKSLANDIWKEVSNL